MTAGTPESMTTETEGLRAAYQAHREGIRKLREWEDNDFDRERSESHMRLFDDEIEDTEDTDDGPQEKA
jgi:hypothetical protein